MTTTTSRNDLVVLVADKNMEFAVKGLLSRPASLRTRSISFAVFQHPWRDAGCRTSGVNFLRPFVNQYEHALLMLDKEGCGREVLLREDLERSIESELSSSGWRDRACAIVIEPELENWVWSVSPHVDIVLGWQGKQPELRTWLANKNFLLAGQIKPDRPKEAMVAALREAGRARSSSLFNQIACKVSFDRCDDPAFVKFKATLAGWFPIR